MMLRLPHKTKQYPIRKRADRRQKHKQSLSSTKAFGHRDGGSACGNSRSVYTTCPVKHIYSQVSREFPVFSQDSWLDTIGAKRLNLGFLVLVCVLSHFEDHI